VKILLLIPALNAGGAERVMVTLANEWSKTEDVTLMVFNDGRCFYKIDEKVRIKPLNTMPKQNGLERRLSILPVEIRRYKAICSEIKNGSYDFVLSFCFTTNVFASLAAMKAKDKKIIVSERNDPYRYARYVKLLVNVLYRKCTMVVCQNDEVKRYFRKHKFRNKLVVLPNPVNFEDIPEERPKHIADEIVTVGRLIEQKNHKLLIDAFKEIKDIYPTYNLKIYGEGPLEEELRQYIKKEKLEDRVFLMGTRKRVMYEVNNSSVFVLSSDFEGFPNVLIEAMATGLPVISTDFKTGVARGLIKGEKNGYLFEVGNKEALVDRLKKLLDRKEEFALIGEENRRVAARYKDDAVAKRWFEVICK
jgi:glycosyltransferase involved in cell wall biosynthesis